MSRFNGAAKKHGLDFGKMAAAAMFALSMAVGLVKCGLVSPGWQTPNAAVEQHEVLRSDHQSIRGDLGAHEKTEGHREAVVQLNAHEDLIKSNQEAIKGNQRAILEALQGRRRR